MARECEKKASKKYYTSIKGKQRNKRYRASQTYKNYQFKHKLKTQFGISVEHYNALLEEQNGVCRICGNLTDTKLCIDHNHTTGVVRGLLCRPCNLGLGNLREDIVILENMIKYLKEFDKCR